MTENTGKHRRNQQEHRPESSGLWRDADDGCCDLDEGRVDRTARTRRPREREQGPCAPGASQLSRRRAYQPRPIADTARNWPAHCASPSARPRARSRGAHLHPPVPRDPATLAPDASDHPARSLIETTTLDDDAAGGPGSGCSPDGEQTPPPPASVSRAVLKVDPEGAQRRHEVARRTGSRPLPETEDVHSQRTLPAEHVSDGRC